MAAVSEMIFISDEVYLLLDALTMVASAQSDSKTMETKAATSAVLPSNKMLDEIRIEILLPNQILRKIPNQPCLTIIHVRGLGEIDRSNGDTLAINNHDFLMIKRCAENGIFFRLFPLYAKSHKN